MTQKPQNIAVMGAGIMGLCAARALAGRSIALHDPLRSPAENASSMAGGMLAPYSEIEHIPPQYMDAAFAGIKFWENIPDSGFTRSGSLLIAHEEDAYILERFAKKLGNPPYANIADIEPALEKFTNGIFLPHEALINPAQALRALADNLRMESAAFDIAKNADNYDWVIDCRGYAAAADDPDLRGVKGEIALVRNQEFSLGLPVRLMHPRYPIYIVPRPDKIFAIGATVIESADDNVTLKSAMELLSAAYSLHPSFAEAEIINIRAGIRPAYPDNLPRITVEGNVIRCNGLFRHGYLFAPVMAQCVADYITGKENEFMPLFLNRHPERSEVSQIDPSVPRLSPGFPQDDKGKTHADRHQRTREDIKRRA